MTDALDAAMAIMEAAFDPHFREAWTRRQVSDSLLLPSTHLLLAGSDGNEPDTPADAAGFALTRAVPGEEELLLIGVIPQMRGRGVGRALLDRFISDAAGRGAENVFLEMRENNPAALLYQAAGFSPIGRRRDYYTTQNGTRIDAVTYGFSLV